MKHLALIAQTHSLIAAGDIVGAESALVALADAEGDQALMEVMTQLPPKDLLAVIREYDSSKESVMNLLVTPAQFARAVVMEKLHKDPTHAHLRGMVNSVIFRADADPIEFLQAVGDLEGGVEALADYLCEKWLRVEAFARSGTFDFAEIDGNMLSRAELLASAEDGPIVQQDEVADQDWMEFTWILRYGCTELFAEVLLLLRAQAQAFDAAQLDDDELEADDGKVETRDTDQGKATSVARPSDEESAI